MCSLSLNATQRLIQHDRVFSYSESLVCVPPFFLTYFFDSTCMIQAASSVLPLISPPVSIGSLIDSIQHIPPSRRSLFLYLYWDVDHRETDYNTRLSLS